MTIERDGLTNAASLGESGVARAVREGARELATPGQAPVGDRRQDPEPEYQEVPR